MKKMFVFALVGIVFCATAAFAAPREVHSWEELQEICRVPLSQRDPQGNSTNDGGRLGYLSWSVDGWKVTDDWKVFSESPDQKKTGDVIPAGAQFYAWFLGGETPQEPTTPTNPTTPTTPASEDQKVEPIEVETFEELQAISSTPLQDNGDGGRGATLTKPLRVSKGQKVLCESDTPLAEGSIVDAGKYIYMWLAPEGYGLKALATLDELRKKGNLDAEEDGVWYTYSPNELVKFASSDIRAFDMNSFGNEVEDCLLRKDGAYRLFLKEKFKAFTPRNDEDLEVLAHPKTKVATGPVWTPDGRTIRNYYVVLASEWEVKKNTAVLYESNVNRAAGEIIPAGGTMLVNVTPIEDDGGLRRTTDGGGGGEGGGGCDGGFGSLALALVALALRKQRR